MGVCLHARRGNPFWAGPPEIAGCETAPGTLPGPIAGSSGPAPVFAGSPDQRGFRGLVFLGESRFKKTPVFGLKQAKTVLSWPFLGVFWLKRAKIDFSKYAYFWPQIEARMASHRGLPPTAKTSLWPPPTTL